MNPFSSIQQYVKFFFVQSDEFESLLASDPTRQVVIVDEQSLWVRDSNQLPTIKELQTMGYDLSRRTQNAFHIDRHIFIKGVEQEVSGLSKVGFRKILVEAPKEWMQPLALGVQLIRWSEGHYFCSQCAGTLTLHNVEIAKVCEQCGKVFYPNIHPVAIVLIHRVLDKKKQVLLAKGLPPREHYSCIAGFVEAGESLENCIRREVIEEVGVHIKNISYFGSQHWPFPSQLMVGFTAEWDTGEIYVDPNEISDAQWFNFDQLPPLPPPISIARKMIDDFLNTK